MGRLHEVVGILACFVVACGSPAAPAPDAGVPSNSAAAGGGTGYVVTSVDDRGAPRFLWSTTRWAPTSGDPARAQLARVQAAYSVSDEALATLQTVRTIPMASGARVTTLRHEIRGIEVFGADIGVLLRADQSLVAISGAPHPAAVGGLFAAFPLSIDRGAIEAIASITGERATVRDRRVPSGRWSTFDLLHPNLTASEAVRARPVYFADGPVLRAAYVVELLYARAGSVDAKGARRVVSAETGAVLYAADLTVNDTFNYRVWADAAKRPQDDPYADFSPHPTGNPDGSQPAPTAPVLTAMESFNTPPGGGADPWLAANATETQGNNVDTYSDRIAPDGFTTGSDFRATTTSAQTFDYTYDLAQSAIANQTQGRAAIVHAFYVANWLHDYWYDSGFDEAAGNAQQDNFGRGGAAGDRMLVEVQDNADTERDNANMFTPSDGTSPRMQIYVWSPQETRTVTLNPGNTNAQAGAAEFGPQMFDVTATVVALLDDTAPATDGCETVTNAAALAGNIALIDRGSCNFIDKTRAAQTAGAIGVIIMDNVVAGTPPAMGGSGGQPVTIPTLSITKTAGDALRAQLMSATVTARLLRSGGALRDGALDSTLVAHEWGHYLHHRMVGGCASTQCRAISEGWGDFVALHMQSRAGDDLDGTFGVAGHAGAADLNSWYWGIRRTPYTSNMAKNPLTFRHIGNSQTLPVGPTYNIFSPSNAEVHNAGEIWTQMMFEAYRRVQLAPGARTFEQVRRDVASYVVAGLALTPADATFTEQRDAVLAAAAASSSADFTSMAQGFAVRGAGTCAVGPARTSTTLDGVVESFTLAPSASIGDVTVDDSLVSCDDDLVLDAEERGRLSIEVANTGPVALSDGSLSISSATTGVSFPSGTTVVVPPVPPMGRVTVLVPVELAPAFPQQGTFDLSITVQSSSSCVPSVQKAVTLDGNRDEMPNSSATDTVEATTVAFTSTGTNAANVWSRITVAAGSHAYQGAALGLVTDTQLMSPPLVVGAGVSSMTFRHRHQFEAQGTTNYDGGVIEVSLNNGMTWVDAATLGTIAYGGMIAAGSGNPLANRNAFVSATPGYPAFVTTTVDFGASLANQTVRIRFRIGTDESVGAAGWAIDDIAFTGLTNTPFTTVSNDSSTCQGTPADAGIDAPMVPIDAPMVPIDAPMIDAPAPPDAMVDAMVDAMPDAAPMLDAAPVADAATQDGRHPDAPGTGEPPVPPDNDNGCCSAGGVDPSRHLPLVLAMGLLLRRRRRRT